MKLFRFNDSDDWRWYAESREAFNRGDCFISVTKVLDVVVHEKLKNWWIQNSKNAVKKRSTETADLGTAIHEVITLDLKGELKRPELLHESLKPAFEQWLRLKEKHGITSYKNEAFVFSEMGYAGAADIQGLFDGERAVMDIKTGSYSIKAGWQLGAYRNAIHEMTGEWIGAVGLHIKRDGTIGTPYKYVHHDYCFKAFESALFCFTALYFNKLKRMNWKYLNQTVTV